MAMTRMEGNMIEKRSAQHDTVQTSEKGRSSIVEMYSQGHFGRGNDDDEDKEDKEDKEEEEGGGGEGREEEKTEDLCDCFIEHFAQIRLARSLSLSLTCFCWLMQNP